MYEVMGRIGIKKIHSCYNNTVIIHTLRVRIIDDDNTMNLMKSSSPVDIVKEVEYFLLIDRGEGLPGHRSSQLRLENYITTSISTTSISPTTLIIFKYNLKEICGIIHSEGNVEIGDHVRSDLFVYPLVREELKAWSRITGEVYD